MNHHLEPVETSNCSPFDSIKLTSAEGRDYWSARDLMPLMGYPAWREFRSAIDRAQAAALNQGYSLEGNFGVATKKAGQRGPAAEDYHLSRFAAYLVAMNGDPRKVEVAAAQSYFAVKTYEAESAPAFSVPQTYAEALKAAAEQAERAELEAARARELEGQATSWTRLAESAGDFSVAEAAKVLSRDPGISIGRDRLFQEMHSAGWIFRTKGKRAHWEASQQRAVDTGRLAHKVGDRFWNDHTEEWELPHPTIRVTAKGLQQLHSMLSGVDQVALFAQPEVAR